MDNTLVETTYEDQPILGPDRTPQALYRHSALTKSKEYQISHKDFFVLSLHLSGSTAEEIAELAGFSSHYTVYSILRKKEVILVRQQLLESLELEFEALQKKIFGVVKSKLDSVDERIQLEAVQIWAKWFGKFLPKVDESRLTAEDVVKQILNQQINVSVNVTK